MISLTYFTCITSLSKSILLVKVCLPSSSAPSQGACQGAQCCTLPGLVSAVVIPLLVYWVAALGCGFCAPSCPFYFISLIVENVFCQSLSHFSEIVILYVVLCVGPLEKMSLGSSYSVHHLGLQIQSDRNYFNLKNLFYLILYFPLSVLSWISFSSLLLNYSDRNSETWN